MEQIAQQLTKDIEGNDATSPDFNPNLVGQWGFHWNWDSTPSMAVMFGAGSVVDGNNRAVIPENWREAFRWFYAGIWQKYFIPNNAHVLQMTGNPFASGRVAMVNTFLWYSSRLDNTFPEWDLAALPSYNGVITTRKQSNGILLLNTSQHPAEAFIVANAIATSPELILAWEEIPAFRSLQQGFFSGMKEKHPGVDWQVMVDSLRYADATYEAGMPNYRKSYDRLLEFRDLIGRESDLNLDDEFEKLEADLQALFDEQP